MSMTNGVTILNQVIEQIWNGSDLDLADRLFSPRYVNHGGLIPDLVRGPEAIKVSVTLCRAAFPSFRITVKHLLAHGDVVALHWNARRDEESPDDRSIDGMTFSQVIGDQIVESWTCWTMKTPVWQVVVPSGE